MPAESCEFASSHAGEGSDVGEEAELDVVLLGGAEELEKGRHVGRCDLSAERGAPGLFGFEHRVAAGHPIAAGPLEGAVEQRECLVD